MRILSWNIKQLDEPWRVLSSDASLDLALLQEARPPPVGVTHDVVPKRDDTWTMAGYKRPFRTAAVRLSNRVAMRALRVAELGSATEGVIGVSRMGSLTVVDVECDGETFTCISAYVVWENAVDGDTNGWLFSDASAHRLVSDISALVARQHGHRIIVAGDWNMLRGYGEDGSSYWARRYGTIFDRMAAIGFRCIGPSAPNGRQADPWPEELPKGSLNVPTYHSTRQTPATATRQLDFVFASEGIADRVTARALNEVADWGPSDHCRLIIDIAR